MLPVETIPGIGEGRIKENVEGGKLNYDIFNVVRTFVSAIMYSHLSQQ
jgi:hypothetical protein